jgi:hypothetical protein
MFHFDLLLLFIFVLIPLQFGTSPYFIQIWEKELEVLIFSNQSFFKFFSNSSFFKVNIFSPLYLFICLFWFFICLLLIFLLHMFCMLIICFLFVVCKVYLSYIVLIFSYIMFCTLHFLYDEDRKDK